MLRCSMIDSEPAKPRAEYVLHAADTRFKLPKR